MSTGPFRQHADDETWFQQLNDALQAVEALYQTVSRKNGNTAILARQVCALRAARLAWLTGSRDRARRLMTAALNAGDGQPPANGEASAAASNGQAGEEQNAPGPEAQKTVPERTPSDGGQSALA